MQTEKMKCPRCGADMNHHADKLIPSESAIANPDPTFELTVIELHCCPACGAAAARNAA
jgi:NMD protein affecting ribosome stability and mRNA decay